MLIAKVIPFLVAFLGIVLLAIYLWDKVPGKDVLTKGFAASTFALACWICLFYLAALFKLPAKWALSLACIFLLVYAFKSGFKKPRLAKTDWLLIGVCSLPYFSGYVFSQMLPGCDIAMHGYVTRLIMEQQGLPGTYNPLLPVEQFGSYSAGFHFISATCAMFNPDWLMEGLSIATAISYLVAICGLAFFLTLFASARTAFVVAMVVFWFHRSLQYVVNWGGTPSVLSLGLVFCAIAFIGYALRERSYLFFIMGTVSWCSAVLTHLIPAYTGLYLCVGLVGYWIWLFRPSWIFLVKTLGIAALVASICLMPFVLRMDGNTSPELSKMIWNWQHRMMNYVGGGDFFTNAFHLLGELKFGLSDLTVIAASICLMWMLFRKRFHGLGMVLGIALLLFVLIINTGYWVLPLSELLYPERVMYFYVVPMGIWICLMVEDMKVYFSVRRKVVITSLGAIALVVALYNCWDRYLDGIIDSKRNYDSAMREGFEWIGKHTASDAVIHVAYNTEGMWVPALSYRATNGTHLHFIHLVDSIGQKMYLAEVDHYRLRLKGGLDSKDTIDTLAYLNELVFQNPSMEIFLTRKGPDQ